MRKRNPEYKQMAFETAIRNPERYKIILNTLSEFDGVILNRDNLLIIVCKLYRDGIVSTDQFDISNISDDQLKQIVIQVNLTRNADGGFPKGYCSRFWTYVRTLCELGFVYATFGEVFEISKTAKLLIDDKIDDQIAFSTQAVIFNRKSPFRNVSNDFNFFKFVTEILLKRWEKGEGISYEQFIVSLFSYNGDAEEFLNIIDNVSLPDNLSAYNFVKRKYNAKNKFKTICRDYPDAVLRLLRITGFVTLKYIGKLIIQINEEKIDYINRIFKFEAFFSDEEKINTKLFFNKYSEYSLLLLDQTKKFEETDDYLNYGKKIKQVIEEYKIDIKYVSDLIDSISNGKKYEEFKYIPEPIKLEFYITLLLYLCYGENYTIKPNYKSDSFGLPISQAPGKIGDIEVFSEMVYWLVEVTLMRNRNQQLNNETSNVVRHLNTSDKETYLSLVAPVIHEDTKTFYDNQIIGFLNKNKRVSIKGFEINEFKQVVISKNALEIMKAYTDDYLSMTKKNLGLL